MVEYLFHGFFLGGFDYAGFHVGSLIGIGTILAVPAVCAVGNGHTSSSLTNVVVLAVIGGGYMPFLSFILSSVEFTSITVQKAIPYASLALLCLWLVWLLSLSILVIKEAFTTEQECFAE